MGWSIAATIRAFATVVERAFARMAAERRLAELYNKWFIRRLPTGETLNLPMSPQLAEIFQVLGQPRIERGIGSWPMRRSRMSLRERCRVSRRSTRTRNASIASSLRAVAGQR